MANNSSGGSKILSLVAILMLFFALATSGAFSANNGNDKDVGNSLGIKGKINACHGYGPSQGKNGSQPCPE